MVKIGDIELPEFPLLLAPMEDVSDPPFRMVCKEQGVDLMYTEFISSEGLIRDAVKSRMKLDIFEYERPIGVQIFGSEIESMVKSAEIIESVNPNLLDINYGCPVSKVTCIRKIRVIQNATAAVPTTGVRFLASRQSVLRRRQRKKDKAQACKPAATKTVHDFALTAMP